MLSYPIDEAETLLDSKLQAAKLSLSNCEEDLDFLREQITVMQPPRFDLYREALLTTSYAQTMEVAVARVYNWDVVQKRKDKEEEEKGKGKGAGAASGS